MATPKKDLKQKISEFTYNKPNIEKQGQKLRKSFQEVFDMLNEKKKKGS